MVVPATVVLVAVTSKVVPGVDVLPWSVVEDKNTVVVAGTLAEVVATIGVVVSTEADVLECTIVVPAALIVEVPLRGVVDDVKVVVASSVAVVVETIGEVVGAVVMPSPVVDGTNLVVAVDVVGASTVSVVVMTPAAVVVLVLVVMTLVMGIVVVVVAVVAIVIVVAARVAVVVVTVVVVVVVEVVVVDGGSPSTQPHVERRRAPKDSVFDTF
jgi:hypothetical protein